MANPVRPNNIPERRFLEDLENDIMGRIISRVASSSVEDLLHLRECSRRMNHATHMPIAYENANVSQLRRNWPINLHGFVPDDWEHENRFFGRCVFANNGEIRFRMGMHKYFNLRDFELGIEFLERAVSRNHKEARYVKAMVLMSRGRQFPNQAIEILNTLEVELGRLGFDEVVRKVFVSLREVHTTIVLNTENLNVHCWNNNHTTNRIIASGLNYDEDINNCFRCKWYHEFVKFCIRMVDI